VSLDAARAAAGRLNASEPEVRIALDTLASTIEGCETTTPAFIYFNLFSSSVAVSKFNDHTTHASVLTVFDRAIERAELR